MTIPFQWSSPFLVNTTTINAQQDPAITALADGRFIVVWEDNSQSPDDTSGTAIRAQIFAADGSKSGAEFLVNTTAGNSQADPAITALENGGFVVAWADSSQTGGDISFGAIRAQMFDANGTKSGAEFLVNTTTTGSQIRPAIEGLDDGRFVISWWDPSQTGDDTSGNAIRAQIFNADGSASGTEFLVNTTTTNSQAYSDISALTDGRFVVTWSDNSQSPDDPFNSAIRAQVFNADGTKSGLEFLVNTSTQNSQVDSRITTLADGRFVVSWSDGSMTGGDTSGGAIFAQVFYADGTKSGAEFMVNTITAGGQYESAIAALPDGRFVVAWADESGFYSGGPSLVVRAQVMNADGTKSGAEFLVSAPLNETTLPTVTALADGRIALAWSDYSQTGGDTSNAAVRGQIFDPRIAAVHLNGTTANDDFRGTGFGDVMRGSFGNDMLFGAAGDDELFGQWSDDTLSGNLGNDQLYGDSGDDQLYGNSGSDVLDGGSGNDVLNGGIGNDVLIGGTGNDTLIIDSLGDIIVEEAGGGSDAVQTALFSLDLANFANVEKATLVGTLDLNLLGSAGANVLKGNTGANLIQGLGGHDTLNGFGGDDILQGGNGNDTLDGGTGIDNLDGGVGDDTLDGGEANDVLSGGAGNDIMTGGLGADIFNFAGGHETARITDFQDNKDKINLSAYGFASAAAAKAFAVQDGADVVFTFAAGNVLTVDGITLAQLTAFDLIL